MENEKIAVIVPVFNTAPYLEQCIGSIMAQTYQDLEIILVDDGSSDNSYDICKKMAQTDDRIKVYKKGNGGPLSARKLGIEKTHAEYIMFVDADDWIRPEMCETLFYIMKSEQVDIVISGITRWYSDKTEFIQYDLLPQGKYEGKRYEDVVLENMMNIGRLGDKGINESLANKLFKKKYIYPKIKDAANNYGLHFGEDAAVFYPYMLGIDSAYILHQSFYFHRQIEEHNNKYFHPTTFAINMKALYEYLSCYIEKHEKRIILKERLNLFIANFYGRCIRHFMKAAKEELPQVWDIVDAYNQRYIFPFSKIPPNSRIVLYGAGKCGRVLYKQLKQSNFCKQVIWQDKKADRLREMGYCVELVDFSMDVDFFVIAIENEVVVKEVINQMLDSGVLQEQIVWVNFKNER